MLQFMSGHNSALGNCAHLNDIRLKSFVKWTGIGIGVGVCRHLGLKLVCNVNHFPLQWA